MSRKANRAKSPGGRRRTQRGSSNKNRPRSSISRFGRKWKKFLPFRDLTPKRELHPPDLTRDAHGRSLGALNSMRSEGLSFTKAARKWGLHRDTFHKHARSGLRTLKSGRIKATDNDRITNIFSKPTTRAGVYQDVVARGREERQLFVRWRIAVEEAKRGNWDPIDAFPKKVSIDGVRLPTSHYEIQKIIDALETEDSAFEGPYRVSARPTA